MVETKTVTKAKFLDLYARKAVEEVIVVGAKIYGRTTEEQASNPDGYIVVVADV